MALAFQLVPLVSNKIPTSLLQRKIKIAVTCMDIYEIYVDNRNCSSMVWWHTPLREFAKFSRHWKKILRGWRQCARRCAARSSVVIAIAIAVDGRVARGRERERAGRCRTAGGSAERAGCGVIKMAAQQRPHMRGRLGEGFFNQQFIHFSFPCFLFFFPFAIYEYAKANNNVEVSVLEN